MKMKKRNFDGVRERFTERGVEVGEETHTHTNPISLL